MLRLTFSEQDIKELDYQRYHHPHPRVQRKMEALLRKRQRLASPPDRLLCGGV
jgi:hypothetical protein